MAKRKKRLPECPFGLVDQSDFCNHPIYKLVAWRNYTNHERTSYYRYSSAVTDW